MIYNFKIIGLSILLIFTSCGKAQKKGNLIPVIDIESNVNNMKKIYLSQYIENVRYVALESNLEHPIPWISFSDFSEKYILASNGGPCLLFDNEGHFIRQIGKQGRGPGEYSLVTGVALMNDKIYIKSIYILFEYNIDGSFIRMYKNCFMTDGKYYIDNIFMINDSMMIGHFENRTGDAEYKALIFNKAGEVKFYYNNYIKFKLESRSTHELIKPGFNKFRNEIFYLAPFNDTLFKMNDRYQLIPEYIFYMGKFVMPLSERAKPLRDERTGQYIHVRSVYQTEDFLIIGCSFGKYFPAKRISPELIDLPGGGVYSSWYNTKDVLGIFDKRTGDLVFSEPTSTDNHLYTSGFSNDIDGGPKFFPTGTINDSTLVMDIRLKYLKECISSEEFKTNIPKYPEQKKRLEVLTDSLVKLEFDNPVLMFVTFKNDRTK